MTINTIPSSRHTPSGVAYDPATVQHLIADHVNIHKLINLIDGTIKSNQLKELLSLFELFNVAMNRHLYVENLKIYVYLRNSYKGSQEQRAQMLAFCKDMDRIRNAAVIFLDKYKAIGQDPNLKDSLEKDFSEISEVLIKRNEEEESYLFPMYQP